MKYLGLFILLLIPCLASADDASHRQAAFNLLDATKARENMRAAFLAIVDTMDSNPAVSKMPAAETADMKQAVIQWFDEDFKWEDLRSKLADIYVKAFSEDELDQLLAFYKTPIGEKALSVLPEVMKEGAAMGQQYAASKQSLLIARLQQVESKYSAAGPGGAPATGAASPAVQAK